MRRGKFGDCMDSFCGTYRNKRVLVTGHTGFKGSWLSLWLECLGAQVFGFSVDRPTSPCLFEVIGLDERVRSFQGDVRDCAELKRVFEEVQPDIVFHLAAQPLVRPSYEEPRKTFETNLMGTVNVLECIRATASVQAAVLITSDKCYENVEWEYGYRETDRLGGIDPYSASKACAEVAISSYLRCFFQGESAPKISSTRAGNVIGGGDWAKDRIVPDCMRAWAEQKIVPVRNPRATRPWQHVLEPLSGYLWLGSCLLRGVGGLAGESFNFGPKPEVTQTVEQLIREVGKHWPQGRYEIEESPNHGKKESGLLKLCCDKARERLAWEQVMNFETTAAMTSLWYREYYLKGEGMQAFTQEGIKAYTQVALTAGMSWAR
jgi:CDP-glucose 4,6-dehydratase